MSSVTTALVVDLCLAPSWVVLVFPVRRGDGGNNVCLLEAVPANFALASSSGATFTSRSSLSESLEISITDCSKLSARSFGCVLV